MSSLRIVLVVTLVALSLAVACDSQPPEQPKQYASANDQLNDEFGGNTNAQAVTSLLELSKAVVLDNRAAGINTFVVALKAELERRRLDGSSLDAIQDFSLGQPLAGVGGHQGIDETPEKEPIGPDNVNRQYFDCPPIGKKGTGVACAELVDTVMVQVKAQALQLRDPLEQNVTGAVDADPTVSQQPQDFQENAKSYLVDLAETVQNFGIEVAAMRAEYLLREAGECDAAEVDGEEIARMRGVEEGLKIMRKMIGRTELTFAPQGGECKTIGLTGRQTEIRIEREITKWITEYPLCPDTTSGNAAVETAEKLRRQGIQRAITAHTTTIWVGIIRLGIKTKGHYETIVTIDNCQPKDQVKITTSPLVIDLDGDGLELTTDRVRFDLRATGQPQRATWTGRKEGLLAIDLNKDGRITSGRELFGNRTSCGSEKCADGAAALAIYDSPDRGGNADGRIDKRDKVFKSLRIWVDGNHDGRSQADELADLDSHGIRALSLQANYISKQVPAGKISLTMQVETDNGPRVAYDVWFKNLVSPGFATPLQ